MLTENDLKLKADLCKTLLDEFSFLLDSPLVNFLEDQHWQFIEELGWSNYLLGLSDHELSVLPDPTLFQKVSVSPSQTGPECPASLKNFISSCVDAYSAFGSVDSGDCTGFVNLGMSPKKQHEVFVMGELVSKLLREHQLKQIIDFGSGKGYLPEHLALTSPGVKVVGLDKEEINTRGGTQRNRNMERLWLPLFNKANPTQPDGAPTDRTLNHYHPLTLELSAKHITAEFVSHIATRTSGFIKAEATMLVGLHACGDLTSLLLQTFLSCPHLQSIVSVGCCYHCITQRGCVDREYMTAGEHKHKLSDPSSVHAYPLSGYLKVDPLYFTRNALCIASQAPEKMASQLKLPEKNLYYRAVFQVLLLDKFVKPPAMNVGNSASRAEDFVSYTTLALKKLEIDNELSDLVIMSYYNRFTDSDERKLHIFYQLRTVLTRVIETLFLVDRMLYLRDNNVDSTVSRLFDPVVSPRAYVLVATKL